MRDRLKSERCSRQLRALADADRLKIVQVLRDGPRTVGEVSRLLGSPVANVSHHLQLLRSAGLVVGEKKGRFVSYSLTPEVWRRHGSRGEVVELGCCRLELGQAVQVKTTRRPAGSRSAATRS